MKSLKDIFRPSKNPSQSDLERLGRGEGTFEDQFMEMNDEFNSDAAEGAEMLGGDFSGFEAAKAKFDANIKATSKAWTFKHTMVTLIAVSVVTMIGSQYLFPDAGVKSFKTAEKAPNPKSELDEIKEVYNEPANKEIPEEDDIIASAAEINDAEIDSAVEIPEPVQITPTSIVVETPIVVDTIDEKDPIDIEEVVHKRIEVIATLPESVDTSSSRDLVYSNCNIWYLHKFTVVDYSEEYESPIEISSIALSGTDASYAHPDDIKQDDFPEITTKEYSYYEYLNTTQGYFAKRDYKTALKRYKVILEHFPDDLNAHFYGGLCYYNLGKNKLAIKYLSKAQNHPYNLFQLDAEWYKAKTYFSWGKHLSCNKLLDQIIAEGDYYKVQAERLKSKIKL